MLFFYGHAWFSFFCRLFWLNIKGTALKWFQYFLSDRSFSGQAVFIRVLVFIGCWFSDLAHLLMHEELSWYMRSNDDVN